MTKNDFEKNTAELFISAEEEQKEAPQPADVTIPKGYRLVKEGVTIPEGYRLVKELKSERMVLLVRKEIKEAIKNAAATQRISMNIYVNKILDDYLEKQGLV